MERSFQDMLDALFGFAWDHNRELAMAEMERIWQRHNGSCYFDTLWHEAESYGFHVEMITDADGCYQAIIWKKDIEITSSGIDSSSRVTALEEALQHAKKIEGIS